MDRNYEVMAIFAPSLKESEVVATWEKYSALITEAKGTIDKLDVWGIRKLAYPIQKHSEGFYIVVEFTASVEVKTEFERQLKLEEQVMRYKILKLDLKKDAKAADRAAKMVAKTAKPKGEKK